MKEAINTAESDNSKRGKNARSREHLQENYYRDPFDVKNLQWSKRTAKKISDLDNPYSSNRVERSAFEAIDNQSEETIQTANRNYRYTLKLEDQTIDE